jgi:hypothetical protein
MTTGVRSGIIGLKAALGIHHIMKMEQMMERLLAIMADMKAHKGRMTAKLDAEHKEINAFR